MCTYVCQHCGEVIEKAVTISKKVHYTSSSGGDSYSSSSSGGRSYSSSSHSSSSSSSVGAKAAGAGIRGDGKGLSLFHL